MAGTSHLEAHQLGGIKNSLGLLSSDGQRVRPKALLDLTGMGAAQLARTLEKPRPRVYQDEIPLKPSSQLRKRIISLVIVADLAFELFQENFEETKRWLMLPNSTLFGDSPFDVCMRGEGDQLIQWLNQRLGREAGAAF